MWSSDGQPDRIVQVLFPGGHSDVGGGYAMENGETGLSDCALQWMTGELTELGVAIGPPVIPENPDPCGTGHQEWAKPLWRALPTGARKVPDAPELHLSAAVIARMMAEHVLPDSIAGAVPAAYLPENIASYVKEMAAAEGVVIVPL